MPPTDREFTGHDGSFRDSVRNSVRRATPRTAQAALAVGAALAIGAVGTALALTHLASPVRAPFVLFYLFVAPALAVALLLRDADPLGRAVVSTAAGVVLDLLLAAGMLALREWSVDGGIVAVTVVSSGLCLLPLLPLLPRMLPLPRRTARGGTAVEPGTDAGPAAGAGVPRSRAGGPPPDVMSGTEKDWANRVHVPDHGRHVRDTS